MPGTLEEAGTAVSRAISICRDAEQGFRGAAAAARDPQLIDLFNGYAQMHAGFATTLQEAVKALGYDASSPAGLGGVVYGGWINLIALVTKHDRHNILVEAERGEEWVASTFREAAEKNLPVGLRTIVETQRVEIEKAHEILKQRRDATAPKPDETAPSEK